MNAMDVLTAGSVAAGFTVETPPFLEFLRALPAAVYATDQNGKVMLERALVSDLREHVEMTFGTEGLGCMIDVPLG
jgi:hypothetical protein